MDEGRSSLHGTRDRILIPGSKGERDVRRRALVGAVHSSGAGFGADGSPDLVHGGGIEFYCLAKS